MTFLERFKLLQRKGVNWPHQLEVALEFTSTGRWGNAFGQFGLLSVQCRVRVDVEVAAHHLGGRLEPQPSFGFVDLDAVGAFGQLAQFSFGGCARGPHGVELLGEFTNLGRLRPTLLAASLQVNAEVTNRCREHGLDSLGKPFGSIEYDSLTFRFGLLDSEALKSILHFTKTTAQYAAALF